MRTENFDEEIRKKMESVEPPIRSDEVDAIHEFIKRNNFSNTAVRSRNINTYIHIASGLTIGILLFIVLIQVRNRSVLRDKIEVLSNLSHTASPLQVRDTVYVEEKNNSAQGELSREIENAKQPKQATKGFSSFRKENSISTGSDTIKKENESDRGSLFASTSEQFPSNNVVSAVITPLTKSLQTSINRQKPDSVPGNANDTVLLSRAGSLYKKNTSPVLKREEKSSHFKFPYIHYRTGASFEMANEQMGGTISGEIFCSEKFSFGAGIQVVSIEDNTFSKDDNDHRQEGFTLINSLYVPDTSVLSSVKREYTLIRVPVFLTYHVPLRNNYSLLFSLGTDLDIYVKEYIYYQHFIPENNSTDEEHFSQRVQEHLFNNLNASFGVEKKWKHFVLQGKPYISPQVIHVAYKREDLYIGFSLRMIWDSEK